jgi:8-oxo-dGTP diphosphatase
MVSRPTDDKPLVALVVVIFTVESGTLQVLLIRRSAPPFQGFWALPGGVFSGDEALAKAAARRLVEETGLEDVYLEQLYTFTDLDPNLPSPTSPW